MERNGGRSVGALQNEGGERGTGALRCGGPGRIARLFSISCVDATPTSEALRRVDTVQVPSTVNALTVERTPPSFLDIFNRSIRVRHIPSGSGIRSH